MALTLESALSVKRKALADTRNPDSQALLRTFFSYWAQHKRNADLQFVGISGLQTADVVLADVPARLMVLFLRKPAGSTVDSWAKISDHAAAAAATADEGSKLVGTNGGGQEICKVFPQGLRFATGITIGAHTTVGGAAKSLVADAPVGFGIVGSL